MPNTPGHRGVPVHDIARELGFTSKQVTQLASRLGVRVASPAANLSGDQANQIKAAWRQRTPPPPDWQARERRAQIGALARSAPPPPLQPRPAPDEWPDELAPLAAALGVPAPRPPRDAGARPRRQSP